MLLGIDIGGTKTCVCAGDANGVIAKSKTFATSPELGPHHAVQEIEKIVNSWDYDFSSLGISCPGPLNVAKGQVLNPPNLPNWENFPIMHELKKRLKLPTVFNNDANAAVLAEYHFGEFKHSKNLIYLTMSTGMGAGIILNDKLIQGESDTAGEVGHIVLEKDGPKNPTGIPGCFEYYTGGGPIAQRIQEELKKGHVKSILIKHIEDMGMHHILAAAKQNDLYALKIWEGFVDRLAQGIAMLIMTLNPKHIVLGTIAIHAKEFLMNPLHKALTKYCWKAPLDAVTIKPSKLKHIPELSALALAIWEK